MNEWTHTHTHTHTHRQTDRQTEREREYVGWLVLVLWEMEQTAIGSANAIGSLTSFAGVESGLWSEQPDHEQPESARSFSELKWN